MSAGKRQNEDRSDVEAELDHVGVLRGLPKRIVGHLCW